MNQNSATISTTTLGAAALDRENKLTLRDVAFAAIRRIGYGIKAAYDLIEPGLTDHAAERYGRLSEGRTRNAQAQITLEQAMSVLGDYVPVMLALSGDDPMRLAAAREINKLSGRYERAATVSDMAALMGAMAANQPSINAKSTADYVETLAETVDLTRPGDTTQA